MVAVAHVPNKVIVGAAALALSSLLVLYRRRCRRSAPTRAPSPAAQAAPAPTKAPPKRETLTVELRDISADDVDLLTDPEASPEPVALCGGAALPEELVRLWREERLCDAHQRGQTARHTAAPRASPRDLGKTAFRARGYITATRSGDTHESCAAEPAGSSAYAPHVCRSLRSLPKVAPSRCACPCRSISTPGCPAPSRRTRRTAWCSPHSLPSSAAC